MDDEKKAELTAAIRDAACISEVFEILKISPTSPEATYVKIVWEALC